MYTFNIFIIHFLLSLLLFFIVNWIGTKSITLGYITMGLEIKDDETPAFNFLFRVLSPVVYIILVGVILQNINGSKYLYHIYLITIYYWVIRLLYTFITNRIRLTNWTRHFFYWTISIGLSIWINSIIQQVEQILPTPKTLLDQFWILILLFLYSVFNNIRLSNEKSEKRKHSYIIHRYSKFHKKYDKLITENYHNNYYECITYSIMIYENFNRPIIIRLIEYISFFLTSKEHSLGIMQVKTQHYINDKESLILAINKIKEDSNIVLEDYDKDKDRYTPSLECFWINNLLSKYNAGYSYNNQVSFIYDYLMKNIYSKTTDEIKRI